ncbi:MAG: aminotransferase class I/II-fold pyridoxal phosphate-dependent enzyme [Paenibacillus sp.]|nr:aminotransferase class I/II-fold pyridoxal phosphate-dependent enzyme [Paenibacillus sp.]
MGAMLHIQGNRVSIRAVQRYLAMLQSSSPSYPIMASLDASRKLLHTEGRDWLSRGLGVVSLLEAKLTEQPWWKLLAKEPTPAYATKDPFKVAVTDATGTLSGFQLRDEIEQRGIMTEMADSRYVLFVFSLASEPQDAERLFEALHPIAQTFGLHEKAILPPDPIVGESQTPEEKQSPCSLPVSFGDRPDEAPAKKIALSEAAGAVSAEMVIPYPPGIPVLYPGEPITKHAVRQITDLAHKGARFQGMADSTAKTIRIQHI